MEGRREQPTNDLLDRLTREANSAGAGRRSPRKSAKSSAGQTRSLKRTAGSGTLTMTATVERRNDRHGQRPRRAHRPRSSTMEFPASSRCRRSTSRCTSTSTYGGNTRTLTLEVEQHLGDNLVRAISRRGDRRHDPRRRGGQLRRAGVSVPVGDVTKGHVFQRANGDPLDVPKARLDIKERWPIQQLAAARPARRSRRPGCSSPASRSST